MVRKQEEMVSVLALFQSFYAKTAKYEPKNRAFYAMFISRNGPQKSRKFRYLMKISTWCVGF